MNEQILKSLRDHHSSQAERLVSYFRGIYGTCEGRQYPQIITCLNAIYRKEYSDDELKKIITDGDGDGGLADAIVFRKDSFDIFDFKEGSNIGLRDIQKFRERLTALVFPPNHDESVYSEEDCFLIKKHLYKYSF